jgi:nucleoside-diphosphate-sugar epimerase
LKHLICVGLGFSARALAPRLIAQGWRVTGTSRSVEGAERLRTEGYEAFQFDGAASSEDLRGAIQTATHLLVSAPPRAEGDPLLAQHQIDVENAESLEWIGYLSTIGVYGDHEGGWVDETAVERPNSERQRRRIEAEGAWLSLAGPGRRSQVFRLAGIYGSGRSAIDKILAGTARRIAKPGHVFNRIHVDDIAGTLEAAMMGGGTQSVYNVTDDEPAPPEDVIAYAAQLLGRPLPPEVPFEKAELSAMARSFYADSRRVRNDRLKRDLGVKLRYPTYREGLAAIAAVRS